MKIFIFSLMMLSSFARAETCGVLMAPSNHVAADLISYFETLLDTGVLKPRAVQEFAAKLETGSLENPLSSESTSLRIHAREVDAYLRDAHLNRQALLQWARAKLLQGQLVHAQRANVRKEIAHRKMKFVRVHPAGVNYQIDVMDTPVTQAMWVEVMGENPSGFKIDGQTQADHPVEQVSWFAAAVFANRMSEREGLEPFYHFSGTKSIGRAEDGSLLVEDYTFDLHRLMSARAPWAEGYRLPQDKEFYATFLQPARDAILASGSMDFYMWSEQNSEDQSHAVADLSPPPALPVELYDVFGNVAEWMNDWTTEESGVAAKAAVSGGSFATDAEEGLNDFDYRAAFMVGEDVGFRLVRTVR